MKKTLLTLIWICCCFAGFSNEPVEAPAVRYVTPNVNQVNAPAVWRQGYRGQDVVIAVLDSGDQRPSGKNAENRHRVRL